MTTGWNVKALVAVKKFKDRLDLSRSNAANAQGASFSGGSAMRGYGRYETDPIFLKDRCAYFRAREEGDPNEQAPPPLPQKSNTSPNNTLVCKPDEVLVSFCGFVFFTCSKQIHASNFWLYRAAEPPCNVKNDPAKVNTKILSSGGELRNILAHYS